MRSMPVLLLSAATALAALSAVPALSLAADNGPNHNFQQQEEQRDVAALHQSAQEAAGPPAYRIDSSHVARLND